jgi:hypothetical protein
MCFDRNINGNRDVKFLIGIIGHCTDGRNSLYHENVCVLKKIYLDAFLMEIFLHISH